MSVTNGDNCATKQSACKEGEKSHGSAAIFVVSSGKRCIMSVPTTLRRVFFVSTFSCFLHDVVTSTAAHRLTLQCLVADVV